MFQKLKVNASTHSLTPNQIPKMMGPLFFTVTDSKVSTTAVDGMTHLEPMKSSAQ